MSEATDAIALIKAEFPKYGDDIYLKTEGQAILPTDPTYDFSNPANNKGIPVLSDVISAFVKEVSLQAQKELSDALGKNIVGKRVKQFTFYTDIDFDKVNNQIMYKDDEYDIVYINEKTLQNTTFLYKIIGAN